MCQNRSLKKFSESCRESPCGSRKKFKKCCIR
ncbi:SEC-C metal-binding domain-containing protein [Candidatus Nitrotoga arctica]